MKPVVIEGKSQHGVERDCKFDGDCFVAGTLVHTDKGLVPIEQLKVGDIVLSKHESGEGEQAYRRVLSTFKSAEKKRIVNIKFLDNDNHGEMSLFCTEDHLFWVDEMGGWTPLKDFPRNEEVVGLSLRDINHDRVTVRNTPWIPLRKTEVEDIALCSAVYQWEARCGYLMLVDFRNQHPMLVGSRGDNLISEFSDYRGWSPTENIKYLSQHEDDPEVRFYTDALGDDLTRVEDELDNAYKTYVYNIEVEDFHTYYVGHAGIWVHNADGF